MFQIDMAKEKGYGELIKMKKDEFERLIIEYQSQMYRLALSILKNEHDAEDVVGDAILTAWERLSTLKDPTKFKFWIMTIIANNAKTFLRKKKRVELMDSLEDVGETADAYGGSELELWNAVMNLKEKHSKIIVLYYYFGFSVKEISKILHLTQGTVKSRLSRGREALRNRLEL